MRLLKITGPVPGVQQITRFLSWTGRLITSAALILYFAFAVRSLRARRPRCSPLRSASMSC